MRLRISWLLVLLAHWPHHGVAQTQPSIRREVSPLLVLREHSGFGDEARLVVRDSALWAALWPRVIGPENPMPARPAVDFTRQLLIIAAMGGRRSGGFGITVDSVVDTPAWLVAYVRSTSPGFGCLVTMGFTQPIRVVATAVTPKPIYFEERAEQAVPCLSVR